MKKEIFILYFIFFSSTYILAQKSPNCEDNIDAVDTTTVVSNTLQASNTLTVNRKLNSGDTLRLIGGQLIELLPGFEAEEGSFVEGENGECIDLSSPPVDCFDPCQDIGILRPIDGECYYEWQNEDIPEEERNERYINVCPEETTTYVLKVVYTDGSIDEKEYEVEVIEFEFTQSPYYLCSGESSVTLKVNTLKGYTYEWSNVPDGDVIGTGTSLEATEPGTYYFTISDDCGNSYTKSVEVQSADVPNIDIITEDPSLCIEEEGINTTLEKSQEICALNTLTLEVQGDGDLDYLWSNDGTGTTTDVSDFGTYSVTATDNVTGCTAEDEVEVEECLDCKPRDYRFKLFGQLFKDGDDAYVCPSCALPTPIELVFKDGSSVDFPVNWTGATGSPSSLATLEQALGEPPFVMASFEDNGESITMTLNLLLDPTVTVNRNDQFSLDKFGCGECEKYEGYEENSEGVPIPWKYLQTNIENSIEVESKGYYTLNLKANDQSLMMTPLNMFTQKKQPVTLQKNGANHAIDVTACHPNDVVFRVLADGPIQKTVNFVYLCRDDGDCVSPRDFIFTCGYDNPIQCLIFEANEVFKQVGVKLILNEVFENVRLPDGYNYDGSNGKLSKLEQTNLHNIFTMDPSYRNQYFNSDYLIFIAHELEPRSSNSNTLGRATTIGQLNTMSLNSMLVQPGSVLPHEIGHASFGLVHPNKLSPAVNDDSDCLMYHANEDNFANIKEVLIRYRSFKKIHEIR